MKKIKGKEYEKSISNSYIEIKMTTKYGFILYFNIPQNLFKKKAEKNYFFSYWEIKFSVFFFLQIMLFFTGIFSKLTNILIILH